MTMSSLLKMPSLLRSINLRNALATWKEMSGWIGKPCWNSMQCLLTGRHSKPHFLGTTQMLQNPSLLWQTSTSSLKNIPTGTFHPSLSSHHLTGSSDSLPLVCWPPAVFASLKSRRHIRRASTWSFAGFFTFILWPKRCHT